jgi:predicted small secreted protein
MKIINLFLAASFLLTACNNKTTGKKNDAKEDTAKTATDTTKTPMPGSDKDEHGCIASAGYRWSVVKNECIRIWEAGIKLNPTDAVADKTTSVFVVFDKYEGKAEVYIPGQPGSVILEYGKKNSEIWFNDDWHLEKTEKGLLLKKDSAVLYAE